MGVAVGYTQRMIEYEATFMDVDVEEIRERLQLAGAELVRPMRLMRRYVFFPPSKKNVMREYIRVRDEGEKVTMSWKCMEDGGGIEDQKEVEVVVDSFEKGKLFLEQLGCEVKAYQESKREKWMLDEVEVCIDEWPWVEPYVEVEGGSEEAVREVSEKLGFDWNKAYFGALAGVYSKKYDVSEQVINNETKEIRFELVCPWIGNSQKV